MAAPDSSDLRQAVSRLTLRLCGVHGLVALIFLLCLHHIYPVEAPLKSAILVRAALTIATLGALLQSFT